MKFVMRKISRDGCGNMGTSPAGRLSGTGRPQTACSCQFASLCQSLEIRVQGNRKDAKKYGAFEEFRSGHT
jgi:hypothetical protein